MPAERTVPSYPTLTTAGSHAPTRLILNRPLFECYICHRRFKGLIDLNRHLDSPAHQQNICHCPHFTDASQNFKTLGALVNHLESEACGCMRFNDVQRNMNNLVWRNRLLLY